MAMPFNFVVTFLDGKEGDKVAYTGGSFDTGASAPAGGTKSLDSHHQVEIQLTHGQSVNFTSAPGKHMQVEELPAEGYTASYSVNGDDSVQSGDTGEMVVSGPRTIDFLNTRDTVVPTGISDNIWPFALLLLVVLALGLSGFAAGKFMKRRTRMR